MAFKLISGSLRENNNPQSQKQSPQQMQPQQEQVQRFSSQQQQPQEEQNYQPEGLGSSLLKHATRLGAQGVASLGGLPASLSDIPVSAGNLLYKSVTGKESPIPSDIVSQGLAAEGWPTKEKLLKGFGKLLPKGYLESEPGSWQELGDRVLSNIVSGKAFGLSTPLAAGKVALGETASGITKKADFGRLNDAAQLLVYTAASQIPELAGLGFTDSLNNVKKSGYDAANKALKESGYKFNTKNVTARNNHTRQKINAPAHKAKNPQANMIANDMMDTIDEEMATHAKTKEVPVSPKGPFEYDEKGNRLTTKSETNPGKASGDKALEIQKLINDKIEKIKNGEYVNKDGKKIDLTESESKAAISELGKIKKDVIRPELDSMISKVPEFGHPFTTSEGIHAAQGAVDDQFKFIKDNSKLANAMKTPWLKSVIFGAPGGLVLGTISKYGVTPALKGAAALGTGLGIAKGYQNLSKMNELKRINPTAKKVSNDLVKASFSRDQSLFGLKLKQLDTLASKANL